MERTNIKMGGVPEHFNYPYLLAIDSMNVNSDVKYTWENYPGGTGAMIEALRSDKVDAALLLTEGAFVASEKDKDLEIIGQYVSSPLNWGVHVGVESKINSEDDINIQNVFAISRYGSGSHLMSYVYGLEKDWDLAQMNFEVVNNLDGAADCLRTSGNHIFLWEKVTTQPRVTSGDMKRVGVLPTPWPCFVLVVKKNLDSAKKEQVKELFAQALIEAENLKSNKSNSVNEITKFYQLEKEGVEEWFSEVEWSKDGIIEESTKQKVVEYLKKAGRLDS